MEIVVADVIDVMVKVKLACKDEPMSLTGIKHQSVVPLLTETC
jgi:hypothetical protein